MSVIDRLITQYELDDSNFQRGSTRVVQATNRTHSALSMASQGSRGFGTSLQAVTAGFSGVVRLAGPVGTAIAAIGASALAATAAFVGLGISIIQAVSPPGAEMERLKLGLDAIEGSAINAKTAMDEIKRLGKLPSIDLKTAADAWVKLRGSGMDFDTTSRAIEQFSNALARMGRGKEDIQGVATALSQMQNKPFLQGEELLQLSERGLPAHKMVKDAFGTADTEELKKRGITSEQVISALILKLSEMPRVAPGFSTAMENMGSSIEQFKATAGEAVNSALLPWVTSIGGAFEQINQSGVVQQFTADIMELLGFNASPGESAIVKVIVSIMAAFQTGIQVIRNVYDAIASILDNPVVKILMKGALPSWMPTPFAPIPQAMNAIGGMYNDNYNTMMGRVNASESRNPDSPKPRKAADPQPVVIQAKGQASVKQLEKIEKNTREMADQQRYILGGNDIGRLGVTPEEKARMRRGPRGSERAGGLVGFGLEMTLGDLIDQRIYQMRRAGAI